MAQSGKYLPAMQEMQETWVRSLGQEDPLEDETAAHSSILAWRVPQTEEPGRPQTMGSQRVRPNLETEEQTLEVLLNFFKDNILQIIFIMTKY